MKARIQNSSSHALLLTLWGLCVIQVACHTDVPLPTKEEEKGPSLTERLVSSLDSVISPFHSLEYQPQQVDDLASLLDGDFRVYGLGEPTHGNREIYKAKARMIQYLVSTKQVQVLTFELDYGVGLYLNDFITGRSSVSVEELFTERLADYWIFRTREFKALIEWLRQHNEGLPQEDQVHCVGTDIQIIPHTLDYLVASLAQVNPESANRVSQWAPEVVALRAATRYTEEMRQSVLEKIAAIRREIDENALQIGETDVWQGLSVTQIGKILVQYESHNYAYLTQQPNNGRDAYMAENVNWAQGVSGSAAKAIFWGHNAHVKDIRYAEGLESTGFHLREKWGVDYLIVGFSFARGNYSAISVERGGISSIRIPDPLEFSINSVFSQANTPMFWVKTDDLQANTTWGTWLKSPQKFINLGSVYRAAEGWFYEIDLLAEYDRMVQINFSTPTQVID